MYAQNINNIRKVVIQIIELPDIAYLQKHEITNEITLIGLEKLEGVDK